MNHADLYMIRFQTLQLVFEGCLHLFDIARTFILSVIPDCAQMSLKDESLPPSPKRASQIGPHIRVGRVQINTINASLFHDIYEFFYLLIGLVYKPFAPHADLADLKSRSSQFSIFHDSLPPSYTPKGPADKPPGMIYHAPCKV